MTHDELLARVDEDEKFLEQYFGAKFKGQSALRAVVELHHEHTSGSGDVYCYNCQQKYPCLTIQAIDKELE